MLEAITVTVVVLDAGEWWTRQEIHLPPGSREIRVHGPTALKTELRNVSSATVVVVPPGGASIASDVEGRFPGIATCLADSHGGSTSVGEGLTRAVVRAQRLSPAGLVIIDPGRDRAP